MRVRLSPIIFAFGLVGAILGAIGAVFLPVGLVLLLNSFGAGMPLLVIGIAFLAFGVPAVTIAVLRHRRLKRIVSLGNVIEAQIVNVRQSRHVMINDSYPWQIVCYWQNPDTFQTHEFVSGFLNDDPHPALMWRGLTTLPVYFDPANPKDYHLDVSPLTEPQSLR